LSQHCGVHCLWTVIPEGGESLPPTLCGDPLGGRLAHRFGALRRRMSHTSRTLRCVGLAATGMRRDNNYSPCSHL
jgi:hypothetical protein